MATTLPALAPHDLRYVAQRLPRDVRELLHKHGNRLFVGGGFVRATIAGETPSDIDMFGDDPEWLLSVAHSLMAGRPGAKMHRTKNAITIITPDRLPVQFITRWTFKSAADLVRSFDFTVCQAAIWRRHGGNGDWRSAIGDRFYMDLAGRRLFYTDPVREEEAGGSMLRVLKYVKRGYSIQVDSLGRVIARMHARVNDTRFAGWNPGAIFAGMLREVDPLLVIDGFEVVDDHEPEPGENNTETKESN